MLLFYMLFDHLFGKSFGAPVYITLIFETLISVLFSFNKHFCHKFLFITVVVFISNVTPVFMICKTVPCHLIALNKSSFITAHTLKTSCSVYYIFNCFIYFFQSANFLFNIHQLAAILL